MPWVSTQGYPPTSHLLHRLDLSHFGTYVPKASFSKRHPTKGTVLNTVRNAPGGTQTGQGLCFDEITPVAPRNLGGLIRDSFANAVHQFRRGRDPFPDRGLEYRAAGVFGAALFGLGAGKFQFSVCQTLQSVFGDPRMRGGNLV